MSAPKHRGDALFPDLTASAELLYCVSLGFVSAAVRIKKSKQQSVCMCVTTVFSSGGACWFLLLLDHVETFIYSGTIGNHAVSFLFIPLF